jgi:tRNA A-37 threonylcarbamoyl transferase component Bud32
VCIRIRIAQLYGTLHGAGVVHGDVQLRHIFMADHDDDDDAAGRSPLKLIDFDLGSLATPRHGSMIGEVAALIKKLGADAVREGYRPAVGRT